MRIHTRKTKERIIIQVEDKPNRIHRSKEIMFVDDINCHAKGQCFVDHQCLYSIFRYGSITGNAVMLNLNV